MAAMYTLSSPVRAVALAMLFAAPFARAGAQVRLPGMTVTAAPVPPGPKLFTGVVKDTLAFVLDGVEIIIPALQRRTFTKDDGTFRFDSIPRGEYAVRARKFGYAPQIRTFKVEAEGGLGDFALMPLARALPAMVSSAVRGGLSGTIADTGYNALSGALVKVNSKALLVETDSVGSFFLPLPPGSYVVAIRKEGFANRVVGVTVPQDSGRHLTAFLSPAHEMPVREVHNVDDFEERQAWRNKLLEPFYSREDIQKMGIVWIHDLLKIGGGKQYDLDCYVLVDGGPTTMDGSELTVDDVEAVEIYQSGRFGPGPQLPQRNSTRAAVKAVPKSNAERLRYDNKGKSCPLAYVWLR